MGPLGLISCQRKNPETNSGEGSCLQSNCFQPWMRAGIPPSSPTAASLSGMEFISAHRLGEPYASATKEETLRDGHPHYPPPHTHTLTHRRRDCWSTKKVLITCAVPGSPCMVSSFHHFSHTEIGLFQCGVCAGLLYAFFQSLQGFQYSIQRMFRLIVGFF